MLTAGNPTNTAVPTHDLRHRAIVDPEAQLPATPATVEGSSQAPQGDRKTATCTQHLSALAQHHPKLIAKMGYVAIDCCDTARVLPESIRPTLRCAHTALVLAKVCTSPLNLPPRAKNVLSALRALTQSPEKREWHALCHHMFGLTNTLKDVYKLLTKSQLLASGPLKTRIQMISAIGMVMTFGDKLLTGSPASRPPQQHPHPQQPQQQNHGMLNTLEAITYVTMGLLLLDQTLRQHQQHEILLPWLSACTVVCALGKIDLASTGHNKPKH